MAASSDSFSEALTARGIDAHYHAVLAELTAGEKDYIIDIVADDLEGREDANGTKLTAPVARGIVRKLRSKQGVPAELQRTPSGPSPLIRSLSGNVPDPRLAGPPMLMRTDSLQRARSTSSCKVSLLRGPSGADGALVRCALRGQLPEGGEKRRKVLAVVLDRSGSMAGAMWRRLVEGVASFATDRLLADPFIAICLVVYSDAAQEVQMPPCIAELRELLLSPLYSPKGGTSFKAAFELAQNVVDREIRRFVDTGVNKSDIDIATLVFTDGEDTSVKGAEGQYGVRLVDKEASSAAARSAGDAFRKALQKTGCSTYVCIAAFGADHDPDQCQYLSDRYYFINRGEALSEVLAGGLGSLLNSAGQCRLRIELPDGVTLAEDVPETLPLDASGRLEHHVWLLSSASVGGLHVGVEAADVTVLKGTVLMSDECTATAGSFEEHLFLVDYTALQLRRIARELCGRRPSADELTRLRARLTASKDQLQPTKQAANLVTGQLRGRAALRERVAEVEALRERLSYALGQFDERDTNDDRKIGTTAIDAILRDARQHVPQGPIAAALVQRADTLAALPPPEMMSTYGKEFTTEAYSCCDAQELASQGDALFFQLMSPKPSPNGCGFITAVDSPGLISLEAFVLLSRGCNQAIKGTDADEGFTHVGFPLYATEGHFLRARLLLPDVLKHLCFNGTYEQGVSERQLLSLLGRSLAASPTKGEMELIALLHKARATYAVLSSTIVNEQEETLLDKVFVEVRRFVEEPASRAEAADLYSIAAAGMLLSDRGCVAQLGDALVAECFRRRVEHALQSAGDSKRLCLAWSLLGPVDGNDAWLDKDLSCPDAAELVESNLNPFTAPAELEALEKESPGDAAPRPDGVASILAILLAKRGDDTSPRPSEWSSLRQQLNAWDHAIGKVGGTVQLWTLLDASMTENDAGHMESTQSIVDALRTPSAGMSLRGVFCDVAAVTRIATLACLGDVKPGECLRQSVAAGMRALVEKRKALALKYPICGASFPDLDEHTGERVREIWGAPANPTDPVLHHKAYLRVWRRTMKCRISMTTKEALTDKEYRKRGGKFVFPSPLDTFIRGLHRRTHDLHRDWRDRLHKETSGDAACEEAVEEMLLRLRWDDSDSKARAKLRRIVARIWDGLEGVDLTGKMPVSSALWLDDASDEKPPQRPQPSVTYSAHPEKVTAASPKSAPKVAAGSPPNASSDAPPTDWEDRSGAARRKMDEGLQAALDEIAADTRRSMQRFAANQRAGSKMKLPLTLTAKQRKAVHLWAEMSRCEHLSFGYRGRRRLHLSVGEVPSRGDAATGGDDSDEEDYDESEDSEYMDVDA